MLQTFCRQDGGIAQQLLSPHNPFQNRTIPLPCTTFSAPLSKVSNDDILFRINKETAGHIINPAASELFCYDSDNHGKALIDGYHWKLTFMQNERIIDIIEGTNGEDNRRYNQIKSVIEFAERFIPYDLGSAYMCIN